MILPHNIIVGKGLCSGYVEDDQHQQSKRGTPQGGVISPLLANIYLNPLDKAFERSKLGSIKEGSIHIIRYADDMIILAQQKLEKGITLLEHYTKRLGLSMNKEKTRRINLKEEKKVEFLGFQFHRVTNRKSKDRLILVAPSPKSQKRCKENIRKLINHSTPLKVKDQIEKLNRFMKGWTGYYRLGNRGQVLQKICQYTNKRVRRLIQRNKGNSGFGWNKISSEYLYGNMGLFYDYKVQWL